MFRPFLSSPILRMRGLLALACLALAGCYYNPYAFHRGQQLPSTAWQNTQRPAQVPAARQAIPPIAHSSARSHPSYSRWNTGRSWQNTPPPYNHRGSGDAWRQHTQGRRLTPETAYSQPAQNWQSAPYYSAPAANTAPPSSATYQPPPAPGYGAPPGGGGILVGGSHSVQKGETLIGISRQYQVPLQNIMQANGLTGSLIYPGQSLIIPGR